MNNLQLALFHADKLENMLIDSGGEITPEIQAEMQINPETISMMVDIKYIGLERLESSIELFEKKSEDFKIIAASLKNAKSYVLDSIKDYLIQSGKKELIGQDYQFKLAVAAPKVEIVNESDLADIYKKEKIEISIDKKLIGEDLKKGIPVSGAVLKENFSLRKSINKGSKQ